MFDRRLRILAILGGIYLCAIGVKLFHMQVLDSERWRLEAAELSRRTIRMTARRGAILDRNGVALAEDRRQLVHQQRTSPHGKGIGRLRHPT